MKRLSLLLTAVFLVAACTTLFGQKTSLGMTNATITINPGETHQTIKGWEATSQAGQDECATFDSYKNELFDRAINDLGINRIRLEIRSGVENDQDYWTLYQNGQITTEEWKQVRYATVNDNSNNNSINWNGFHFAELDNTVNKVVIPLKQLVEANGEKLFINLNYVAFTNAIGSGLGYIHDNPDEYAEFVLATYTHLDNTYGWVPDSWEVILEPDNKTTEWNGTVIGEAIVATAARLQAAGYTPNFVAPSTMNMNTAVTYFDAMTQVSGAVQYVQEFSYHRYGGVSNQTLQTIGSRSQQYGIGTAMLEHIGSGENDFYDDLTIGLNTGWQEFTLAFCDVPDNGAQYFITSTSNPGTVTMGARAKMLRQYFKWVRAGAVRIGASSGNNNFDPVAFTNTDGMTVAVVKADVGGSITLQGLPAGTYGINYSTNSQYDVNRTDITIANGQSLDTSIPAAGIITIYQKSSPPPVTFDEFNYLPVVVNASSSQLARVQTDCNFHSPQ